MFRLILLAGIVYLLLKWLRRSAPPKKKEQTFRPQDTAVEEMMRDPVCGTYVPASQAVTLEQEKETLYFCSAGCRDKFKEIPKTQ
jgi:YHS domain-containing protein